MSNASDDSTDGTARRQRLGYVQLGLILVVVVVALLLARAPERVEMDVGSGIGSASGSPVVSVIRPEPTEQSLTVELTGGVELEDRVSVMSEVAGRISFVSPDYRNGGAIAANEPIVRIDPTRYELELAAAQARVAEAESAAAQGGAVAQAALQAPRRR